MYTKKWLATQYAWWKTTIVWEFDTKKECMDYHHSYRKMRNTKYGANRNPDYIKP